jgi:murein DD-endopeptidase MepM/ murein hydrolase activator NlpD
VSLESSTAPARVVVRLLVALSMCAVLAGLLPGSASPAAASSLDDHIAAIRASQGYSQSAMLAADRVVEHIKSQQKDARKAIKSAKREAKAAKAAVARAKVVLQERTDRLTRVEALYASPDAAPDPEAFRARLQSIRSEVRTAQAHLAAAQRRASARTHATWGRKSRLVNLGRQLKVAISRRESAEASLAASIAQMTDLAARKAEEQAAVDLSGPGSFSWPAQGHITQPYGCTGFRLEPARGSCRHFHDGIDLVSGYGTRIRAVAVGVVAYAGWNPWDTEGRAFVVDIVHPGGYVSRYGHLIPTGLARPGQLVHTGQVIGKMGSTGNSTGTHLHMEFLVNGQTVDPLSYLPAGVVRVDKASTRAGLRDQEKKARKSARHKARARKAAVKLQQPETFEAPLWVPSDRKASKSRKSDFVTCDPSTLGLSIGGTADALAVDGAVQCVLFGPQGEGVPGVPLPYLATAPAST